MSITHKYSKKIKDLIQSNRGIYEQIARESEKNHFKYAEKYNILDYGKILELMIKYVEGYIKYKESDNNDVYKGKVLETSKYFYDSMFDYNSRHKYRQVIEISQFKSINKTYLEWTNKLTNLLEKLENDDKYSNDFEFDILLTMTQRQYDKIAKVYKDDCNIYLWIISKDSKYLKHDIDSKLISHYNNDKTPVMHPGKIKVDK